MGWTTFDNIYDSNKEFYEDEIKKHWGDRFEVIDVSFKGNEIYELVESLDNTEKFIAVTLIARFRQNSNYPSEIGYKTMDETYQPYNYKCPLRILKASTCKNERAVEWRKKCFLKHRQEMKEDKKLRLECWL